MAKIIATAVLLLVTGTAIRGAPSSIEQNTITAYGAIAESVVLIACRNREPGDNAGYEEYGSNGSGFVIEGGLVVTNYHVIANAMEIDIFRSDGRHVPAAIVGTAPGSDIALLRLISDHSDIPPARIGDAGSLLVGQRILAVGSPFGLESSVTSGIVSGLKRDLPGSILGHSLIQFDAPINPGQSGGPLVDSMGTVVGVVTAKIENGEAIGFAIPVDIAISLVPDLIQMGHPFQPQVGLQGTDVTPGLAALFSLDLDVGFLVESVEEGGPADKAGLSSGDRLVYLRDRLFVLGGDIVVSVNGEPLEGGEDLARHLQWSRPGDDFELEVYRDGVTRGVRLHIPPMEH